MQFLTQALKKNPSLHDRAKQFWRWVGQKPPLFRAIHEALARVPCATFVQAGAHDGISNDPFREFIVGRGLRGILVEPVPQLVPLLRNNYRYCPQVSVEQCALSYPARRVVLYLPKAVASTAGHDGNAAWETQLSSISRELVERGLPDAKHEKLATIEVDGRTVEQLMLKHGMNSCDCLFLDVEGHEDNILLSMDYQVVLPRVIVYEHFHLEQRLRRVEEHLAAKGFEPRQVTAQDSIAVRW